MFLVVGGNSFLGSYIIKNILKIGDKESDVEAGIKDCKLKKGRLNETF